MKAKMVQELFVNGMTCSHCVHALTVALIATKGVRSADVDATAGRVTLHTDGPVSPTALYDTISDAGFVLISWQGPRNE